MRLSIIGTGYVGLTTGVGFAKKGHDVICVDIDEEKVEKINRGEPPIYEEGMNELMRNVVDGEAEGSLRGTTNVAEAVNNSELTFICVGTPSRKDGGIDTSQVEGAASDVSKALKEKDGYHVVCVKSTVVPGTTDSVVLPILEESGKEVRKDFGLGMNPEFLREGVALEDFLHPDRIVIGAIDEKSSEVISEAYKDFDCPKKRTDIRTAEMIKYASNALLATKISFANELSRVCEKVGIDVYDVMDGVGLDHRVKRDFLNAGCGFGGSCFPKDVKALVNLSKEKGVRTEILDSVLSVNESQPIHTVELLEEELGDLKGKRIALLGLSFKGGTDDVRETRALPMVQEIQRKKGKVIGYDPKAADNFLRLVPSMETAGSIEETLEGADACIIQSDWAEFKELKSDDFKVMKNKVVLDARRILNPEELSDEIRYIGVGKGPIF